MRVLFVCNQGKHRSRTAAEIFSNKFDTKYCGIYENLPSKEDVAWANVIVTMDNAQRTVLASRFPKEFMQARVLTLDVADVYSYNQLELISELESKFSELIEPYA
ncbi:MAG: hypothetical protein ABIA93_05735 [Candidatus Woesearchaeota archaeon]